MTIQHKTVWTFQDAKQVAKHGEKAASWYIGFIDLQGRRRSRSCGGGSEGRKLAAKLARQVQAQLIAGTFETDQRKSWEDFRTEYTRRIADGMEPGTREIVTKALDVFERIAKPKIVRAITSGMVADFVAARRQEKRSKKSDQAISPASVNKELRCLRAVLRKANKWDYLPKLPDIPFLKEQGKIPSYVTPEHFLALYNACDAAKEPRGLPYSPGEWWRGVLIFAYMTGWRIGSILAIERADVDLDAGTALSRAKDNKGRRDQRIPLHPVILEHMRKLASFETRLFPWKRDRRRLFTQLARIQEAAGVKADKAGGQYGFHDLRRGFASMNADRMTPDALQRLMQHKDYQTTQRYINLARQINQTVESLYVPDVPRAANVS